MKEADSKLLKEQNERIKLMRSEETSALARSELQIIEEENPEVDNEAQGSSKKNDKDG